MTRREMKQQLVMVAIVFLATLFGPGKSTGDGSVTYAKLVDEQSRPVPIRADPGEIKIPTRVSGVMPATMFFYAKEVQGTMAVVELTLNVDGSVSSAKILRSAGEEKDRLTLVEAKKWKYTQTRLNGVAVPIIMEVNLLFVEK